MDKCIKTFLNKQLSQKTLEHTAPHKKLFLVLPYLGMSSLCLRTGLEKSINNNIYISFCKIKIIFKTSTKLGNFFRFKDKMPLRLRSNIIYTLRVVDAMQPITVKRAVILKLELLNTQIFHL